MNKLEEFLSIIYGCDMTIETKEVEGNVLERIMFEGVYTGITLRQPWTVFIDEPTALYELLKLLDQSPLLKRHLKYSKIPEDIQDEFEKLFAFQTMKKNLLA